MADGRFAIERLDDLVLVSQEGWFATPLVESLIEANEAAFAAVAATHGKCLVLADMREYRGCPMVALIKFEAWLITQLPRIRRLAMITNDSSLRKLINASSNFVPALHFRFVLDPAEALAYLERPEALGAVSAFLARPIAMLAQKAQ